jgi:hypothetical protein
MAQVDVNKVDMEGFNEDWGKVAQQYKQRNFPQKRNYINTNNNILNDQYVQDSGSP